MALVSVWRAPTGTKTKQNTASVPVPAFIVCCLQIVCKGNTPPQHIQHIQSLQPLGNAFRLVRAPSSAHHPRETLAPNQATLKRRRKEGSKTWTTPPTHTDDAAAAAATSPTDTAQQLTPEAGGVTRSSRPCHPSPRTANAGAHDSHPHRHLQPTQAPLGPPSHAVHARLRPR